MNKNTERYSKSQKISSIAFLSLGVLTLALTSTGITGNIIKSNHIPADSYLLGFSLGILFITISALVLLRKING